MSEAIEENLALAQVSDCSRKEMESRRFRFRYAEYTRTFAKMKRDTEILIYTIPIPSLI